MIFKLLDAFFLNRIVLSMQSLPVHILTKEKIESMEIKPAVAGRYSRLVVNKK